MDHMERGRIGHNADQSVVRIEARLFNSLAKYVGGDGLVRRLELEGGATIADVVAELKLPVPEIFLVLRNGRDVTPGLYQGGVIYGDVVLEDGDVVAFSGPVPYSYGYGAPVVWRWKPAAEFFGNRRRLRHLPRVPLVTSADLWSIVIWRSICVAGEDRDASGRCGCRRHSTR